MGSVQEGGREASTRHRFPIDARIVQEDAFQSQYNVGPPAKIQVLPVIGFTL